MPGGTRITVSNEEVKLLIPDLILRGSAGIRTDVGN